MRIIGQRAIAATTLKPSYLQNLSIRELCLLLVISGKVITSDFRLFGYYYSYYCVRKFESKLEETLARVFSHFSFSWYERALTLVDFKHLLGFKQNNYFMPLLLPGKISLFKSLNH